jgi:hypothetical protein
MTQRVLLGEWDVEISDGQYSPVSLELRFAKREAAEQFLDKMITFCRKTPASLTVSFEEWALQALSELNREMGPEHRKATGRRAGGGTLTKGL